MLICDNSLGELMSHRKDIKDATYKYKWAIYIIIMIIGISLIVISALIETGFIRDLLLNLGSNLVVVTLLFAIFEASELDRFEKLGLEQSRIEGIDTSGEGKLEEKSDIPQELRGILTKRASSNLGSPSRDYDGARDEEGN